MESGLFFSITYPQRQLSQIPSPSGFPHALSPGLGMALATGACSPAYPQASVHAPDRHLRLGLTVNWPLTPPVLCTPRSPRQRRTSWPTVKLMHGRTFLIIPVPQGQKPLPREEVLLKYHPLTPFVMKMSPFLFRNFAETACLALGSSAHTTPAQPAMLLPVFSLVFFIVCSFTFSFHVSVIFIIRKEKHTFLGTNIKCAKLK